MAERTPINKMNSSCRKGQGGVEYIVLLSFTVVFFLMVIYVVNDQLSLVNQQQRLEQAKFALNEIGNAATDVYQQGAGAQKQITITFPQGVEGAGLITNNTLQISFEGSDLTYYLPFPISGEIPSSTGSFTLTLVSYGASVAIGSSFFSVSPAGISDSYCSPAGLLIVNKDIMITNNIDETIEVNMSIDWSDWAVNFSLSDYSVSIPSYDSINITATFDILPNILGVYSGTITYSRGNYSVVMPVVISVESCAGGDIVSYITLQTFNDSTYLYPQSKFYLPRLSTITTNGWAPNSQVTLDLKDPNNISVQNFPKTVIVNSTGGYKEQWEVNGIFGTYRVIANSSGYNATTTFTVTPC